MLVALPNADKSYTATLYAPFYGKMGFNALATADEKTIHQYLISNFSETVALIPDAARQFQSSPVGALVTTTVSPWYHGRTLLIGDAAHTVLPFFGQGRNASLEDAYLLFRQLQTCQGNVLRAATAFADDRAVSFTHLARLSRDHFDDMAKWSTLLTYHLQKRIENILRATAPQLFMPLYAMIAFTDIPYHTVAERDQKQQRIVTLGIGVLGVLATFACVKVGFASNRSGVAPFLCEVFKGVKLWGHSL